MEIDIPAILSYGRRGRLSPRRPTGVTNMAIWDFRPKADMWTGVAVVGVGLLVAPVVLPTAWSAVRSLLKGIVKGSITVYEKAHELGADVVEGTADLIEEARSEVQSELSSALKTVKASKPAKS